jgi:hypothetical protein
LQTLLGVPALADFVGDFGRTYDIALGVSDG